MAKNRRRRLWMAPYAPEIADSEMYQTDLFSFGIVNFRQIFTGKLGLLDICKLTVQPVALTFRVVI